ncbi:hypothetical protein HPB51_016523 [Rhipicephalus microplus]|uniref:Uncharacterized protein n=1 Tax=Rhipicephalus microplus TaxID=6941 RepID=A0A9J6E2D3_RHIMP|nr:hypothetical protein HPB51_016523 [Rhipicephalus microplus]
MGTQPDGVVRLGPTSVTALTSLEKGNVPSATEAHWTHHPDQYHRHVETHASKHPQTTTGPAHAQNDAAPPEGTQLEGLIVLHPDLNLGPSLGLNHGPNLGSVRDPNELYDKEPPRNLGAAVRAHADEQDIATTGESPSLHQVERKLFRAPPGADLAKLEYRLLRHQFQFITCIITPFSQVFLTADEPLFDTSSDQAS